MASKREISVSIPRAMPLSGAKGTSKVSKLREARMKAESRPDEEEEDDVHEEVEEEPTSQMEGGEASEVEVLTSESLQSLGDKSETIRVCVRIRALVRNDKDSGEVNAWAWETQSLHQDQFPLSRSQLSQNARKTARGVLAEEDAARSRPFDPLLDAAYGNDYVFDHLFNPDHTNDDIYRDVIHAIVEKAMMGYHGSVFTYGQTSSGKTFTMTGTAKSPGIIPQAVFDAFDQIEKYPDRDFLLRICYLEVYKEQVKDLLNPDPVESLSIKVLHDAKTNKITMVGLKEQVVNNPAAVMQFLQQGESLRHIGATNMNEKSSRAHTVFRMIIESKDRNGGKKAPIRQSTLNLIDLAGSENSKMTGSKGEREQEGKFINQSLLALSTIIQRLSEAKTQHLPFRDSKLTRILQEPLSGNAVIAIICTITPALRCADETHNTLKFATRAKKVKLSAAEINELTDERGTLLRTYQEEIAQLKLKLAEMAARPVQVVVQTVTADQEVDEDDGQDQEALLRMIDEMDRFIMKADMEKSQNREKELAQKIISRWRGNRQQSTDANGGPAPVRSESMMQHSKPDLKHDASELELENDSSGVNQLVPAHDTGA